MTRYQRVGQLFLLGLADDQLSARQIRAIRDEHIGSVWFTETTSIGSVAIGSTSDQVQTEATDASTDGVKFLIAANQEGGMIQALQGEGFSTIPSAVEQGKLSPDELTEDAQQWGAELAEAGVNLNFAPVADVVPLENVETNQPIGVLDREYGHDPKTVSEHVAAFIAGMGSAGIATTAKHFPGLGRVVGNTDFTADVTDSVTTSRDPYLDSFQAAIDAGAPFVMVALATYEQIDPDHLAAFSPLVMQDLLREQLGFRGVVMSDDLGATQAVADMPPADRAITFLRAGGDLIVSKTTDATVAMARAVTSLAGSDSAFDARVDDAALHVLEAKDALGLLPCS